MGERARAVARDDALAGTGGAAPGVAVPEDLLPVDERLDKDRLIREHNDGERIFQRYIAAASR